MRRPSVLRMLSFVMEGMRCSQGAAAIRDVGTRARLRVTRWWIPGLEGFWLDQMIWVVIFWSQDAAGRLLMTAVDLSANVVWEVRNGRAGRAEKLA